MTNTEPQRKFPVPFWNPFMFLSSWHFIHDYLSDNSLLKFQSDHVPPLLTNSDGSHFPQNQRQSPHNPLWDLMPCHLSDFISSSC